MDPTRRQILIEETVAAARAGVAAWHDAKKNIEAWQAEQKAAEEHVDRCYAAATAFGFNLDEEAKRLPEILPATQNAPPPQESFADLRSNSEGPTVREFIFYTARGSHPGPVRAADLRKVFKERYGRDVHDKTFGMTLYRMAEQGIMERRGQADWYFVPREQRKPGSYIMGDEVDLGEIERTDVRTANVGA